MGRRTLLLITSVLLAAVGTAMVALYVRTADDRAAGGETTALYVVARQDISANATLTAADLTVREMRVSDQLTSNTTDLDAAVGRVATAAIRSGATIDTRDLREPGALAEGAIRRDELGIDVQLQDPNRAVSLLGVGSTVRIFHLDENGDAQVLVQRARVISIGGSLDDSAAAGPDGTNSVGATTVPQAVVGLSVSESIAKTIAGATLKQEPLYFTVIPSSGDGS
ncbi:SAF domain-containing protein [Kineosporia succinea]|uniref:SAF domain-containing protein n=1 Tax=Kineosporia succinea TaxID=84632 RepID=A0ABT9P6D5_9ACTN|nr:SAF domain-containing protein [Kineosporia succinea]MDP9828251.1 hypothetical protein [Kineosporia succinea]